MTDTTESVTVNYGHKQITLKKNLLFFYHNGKSL